MGVLSSKVRCGYLGLALAVVIAGGLSLSGILPVLRCPLNAFFGVQCPMCGTTRAWHSFLAGRYEEAFLWNPLFLLWGAGCLIAFLDLLHKGLGGLPHTVGEELMQRLAARPIATRLLAACFGVLLIYNNRNLLGLAVTFVLK